MERNRFLFFFVFPISNTSLSKSNNPSFVAWPKTESDRCHWYKIAFVLHPIYFSFNFGSESKNVKNKFNSRSYIKVSLFCSRVHFRNVWSVLGRHWRRIGDTFEVHWGRIWNALECSVLRALQTLSFFSLVFSQFQFKWTWGRQKWKNFCFFSHFLPESECFSELFKLLS